MFCHDRKSFNGVSLPSWVKPGPIYVKNHYRNYKSDLLVEEAELLENEIWLQRPSHPGEKTMSTTMMRQ